MSKKAINWKSNWNPTCKRFVAFLDIMGFRDRVFRESHEEVKKMLESLYPTIKLFKFLTKQQLAKKITTSTRKVTPSSTPAAVFPVLFSDSIILISSDNSYNSAFLMVSYVGVILSRAIDKGIPIKGAIAYGEQTADIEKSLFFGRPLIDAFELQNELQFYGAVLHHTIENHLIDTHVIDELEPAFIFNCSVPMKAGKITHYIVDWININYNKERNPKDSVTKLYKNVSGTPRLYVDNTVEFVNWLTEKKRTSQSK